MFGLWKKNPGELLQTRGWAVSVEDQCLHTDGNSAIPIRSILKVKYRARTKAGTAFNQLERASVSVEYENDNDQVATVFWSGKTAERDANAFADALKALLKNADPTVTFRSN